MNYQTAGHMMDLYQGWFQQNGNCGYVLKPPFLRDHLWLYSGGCAKDPLPGVEPTMLFLKVTDICYKISLFLIQLLNKCIKLNTMCFSV